MAKLKVVRLRKPKVPDDSGFVATLVWALAMARAGKIRGYAMVFVVEGEGHSRTIEAAMSLAGAADEDGGTNKLVMLGAIRRMEANYMAREWPEDR